MSENPNVINFPETDNVSSEQQISESKYLNDADGNPLLDPDGKPIPALPPAHRIDPKDPLNNVTEKQLHHLLKNMQEMVGMLEAQWRSSENEFNIKDEQLKAVYAWNEENRDPPPEGINEEDVDEATYDRWNGIDRIPEELCNEIFPKGLDNYDHPIIGITHDVTKDRIKSVLQDFFTWMGALKEYRQVHDAYMELIEYQELAKIQELEKIANEETDQEKKEKLLNAVTTYYRNKYLDFLQDELDEITMKRLIDAFSNETTVGYWIKKSADRLKQMKISSKVILEVSQFEKRFLDPKYHSNNNIFLLYFLSLIAYSDAHNKTDDKRTKVVCIVFGLDRFIRNQWSGDIRQRILENMNAFQEQFIGKLPKPLSETGNEEAVKHLQDVATHNIIVKGLEKES